MDDLPTIQTQRLVLRVPSPRDAQAMAQYARQNKEHFAPWDPVRTDAYFTEPYWEKELDFEHGFRVIGQDLKVAKHVAMDEPNVGNRLGRILIRDRESTPRDR